jgi:myo-inositol 2-dehydrogenase/D-chiro-inositol 1-dehydrogenase
MAVLGVGVLGAGRIGRLHAEAITRDVPEARVVAIADPCIGRARAAADACGVQSASADPSSVLGDRDVQAVLVCSSTDTHAAFLEQAAAAGKHVFCEKPLDLEPLRIENALAAVARAGVLLQVGFNRRFDAGFRRLAQGVRDGEIGTPEIVRITSRDPQPPPLEYVRVSGGLFLDMTIHDFDLARYLAGDEIVEVFAAGAALVDPGIGAAGDVDTAVVQLRFARGALGCIDNSRRAVYGYDQRAEVHGSRGCLVAANTAPTMVQRWDGAGRTAERPHFFFLERYRDAYVDELRTFVDCVLHDREPPVTGRDGLQATRIARAAQRSLAEQRPVAVEIS